MDRRIITTPADFEKLKGAIVAEATLSMEGPHFRLDLEMPDEHTHVIIVVRGEAKPQLNGNLLAIVQGLNVNIEHRQ